MKKAVIIVLMLVLVMSASAQRAYYVSCKRGNDRFSGSIKRPFKTISRAAQSAHPGDTIIVHDGTYRELISPLIGGTADRRITYRAAEKERVIIKGSEVVKGWQKMPDGIWCITLPDTFFGIYNPFKDLVFGDWFFPGRNKVHTGEVYLDGRPLAEVAKAENALTWSTEAMRDSTLIFANFGQADPNQSFAEINVRPACFYPAKTGVNYITVRGFHFSQAATQWAAPTAEQVGLIGTNWSKGWIIEDNEVSDSKCVGIALGKDRASGHNVWFADRSIDGAVHYNKVVSKVIAEGWSEETIGSHIVRNNKIYRCGQAGICGSFGAAFSEITGNDIYDIYTYRNFWGAEMAGIKLHAGIDALISGNRIHNTQKGIWLDWMTQGTQISGNLLYDNDFVDIFLEVNHGPYLVDNNLFLSDYNLKDLSQGGAFVHNLFAGLISRSADTRTTPYFKPNGTELVALKDIKGGDDRFFNNIFIGRRGKNYYNSVYPSQLPDEIDSLAGYGLSIYDHASLPVKASGNVYIDGAYPYQDEQGALTEFDRKFAFHINTNEGAVTINVATDLIDLKQVIQPVTTAMLGKTSNGYLYTGRKGKSLIIDTDYFGNSRNARQAFAGPIAWTAGQPIQIWPVQKYKPVTQVQ